MLTDYTHFLFHLDPSFYHCIPPQKPYFIFSMYSSQHDQTLLLKLMLKTMICASLACYGPQSLVGSVPMAADSTENESFKASVTICTHPPKKRNKRKLLRRVLQNHNKDTEMWLFTMDGFWRETGGRIQSSLSCLLKRVY